MEERNFAFPMMWGPGTLGIAEVPKQALEGVKAYKSVCTLPGGIGLLRWPQPQ